MIHERGTSYLHIKQSTYLICKIKIIYLIKFGNKFKCINLFHVQNLIFIAYFHSFFASFNFESDLIAENTGITAGSNLIPGPGRQFQVDTSESNLKLAGAQNRFKTGLKFWFGLLDFQLRTGRQQNLAQDLENAGNN